MLQLCHIFCQMVNMRSVIATFGALLEPETGSRPFKSSVQCIHIATAESLWGVESTAAASLLRSNPDFPAGFRRYVKGYALVEYAARAEAQAAIDGMDGQDLLTQNVSVTWAFQTGPIKRPGGGRAPANGAGRRR